MPSRKHPARAPKPALGSSASGNGPILLSRAEFARLAHMSRSAITQAEDAGRLYFQGDRLDPAHPMNVAFLERAKQRRMKKAMERVEGQFGAGAAGGEPVDIAGLVLKKLQYDVDHRLEQIKTLRLKRLRALDHLLPREAVEQALARFNADLEIRLLDLPRRIGPRLAALAKSGEDAQVVSVLEDELSAALRHCKEAAVL